MELIAKLLYKQHDFEVVEHGLYVICAVTGDLIFLEDLKYWSVPRQEAYLDAAASLKRELELKNG
jgi:hypothetical protein